ncbi:lipopolysaccharide biosynthesis protein [Halobacillus campisalis]|uniref:Lipopolysaccharide biosynthesis protein n=1 Tax=Halobacillus campisalis TaxID=435909 RepID=A0ABW2JXT1_9BACI|nr:lipopolysaccharide biosynthesis protein [Halobacillus campisalis]
MNKKTNRTLSETTFNGFLWMISGKGVQGISQLLVLTILARLIAPNEFGIVTAAMVVIGFSLIFSSLGVGPALVQRPHIKKHHISTAFSLSILMGASFTLLIFFCSGIMASFFRIPELENVLKVLSFTFLIQGIYMTSLSLLERNLEFKSISLINSLAYIIGYGAMGIIFGLSGFGVYALVIAQISQEIVKLILILSKKQHSKKLEISIIATKELMYFGGGFTLARIFNYFALQGDNLVVGRTLGAESLGIYGRIYQLMALPATFFGQVVDKVLFSAMSRIQTDKSRLRMVFKRGIVLISLVALPTSIFSFIFSEEIILVLLGEKWLDAVLPFQILSIGIFFRTSYKISESVARSTGAVYRRAWRQLIYAISVIGGSLIGQQWGLIGVAYAINISLILNFLLMSHLSLKILSLSKFEFIKIHVPAILNTTVVFLLLSNLSLTFNNPLLTIFSNFILMGVILLFICTLLPRIFLGTEGKWIIKFMKNYFIKRILKKIK